MKLIYPGPHEAVNVLALGQKVQRGEEVEIPDEIAERLVEQGWESPKPKKAVKATDTAAEATDKEKP